MTPWITFAVGLAMLVLFGWYFATDKGWRKRYCNRALSWVLVVFSLATIWPPHRTSRWSRHPRRHIFPHSRLKGGDKELTKGMPTSQSEVIRAY